MKEYKPRKLKQALVESKKKLKESSGIYIQATVDEGEALNFNPVPYEIGLDVNSIEGWEDATNSHYMKRGVVDVLLRMKQVLMSGGGGGNDERRVNEAMAIATKANFQCLTSTTW